MKSKRIAKQAAARPSSNLVYVAADVTSDDLIARQLHTVLWALSQLLQNAVEQKYMPSTRVFQLQELAQLGVGLAEQVLDEATAARTGLKPVR